MGESCPRGGEAYRLIIVLFGFSNSTVITYYCFFSRFTARREIFYGIFNGKFARLTAVFTVRESNFPKTSKNSLGFVQCSEKTRF